MVDRIQIEEDRLRTRDASGNVTFDSDDKYLKTSSGGNFDFSGFNQVPYGLPINDSSGTYQGSVFADIGYCPVQNPMMSRRTYKMNDTVYSTSGFGYVHCHSQTLGVSNILNRGNILNYVAPKMVITGPYREPQTGRTLILNFPIGMNSYTYQTNFYGAFNENATAWCSTTGVSRANFTASSDQSSKTFSVNFGLQYDDTVFSFQRDRILYRGAFHISPSEIAKAIGSGETFRVNFPDIRSSSYGWYNQPAGGNINYGDNRRTEILNSVGSEMIFWSGASPAFLLYGDPIQLDLAVTP